MTTLPAEPPIIVLLSQSADRERHWQSLLSEVNCRLMPITELASSDSPVDLVITDNQQQLEDFQASQAGRVTYGVIAIGSNVAADVAFSSGPSERELRLACDLLGEVVRLRRECAANRQQQQLLTELAELDPLTGIANRRAWDAALAQRMHSVQRGDSSLCLALLDLDHFKEINTARGYTMGDKVLRQVGHVLATSVRSEDFVARLGGDEFGVLFSNLAAERADSVVERIRASLAPALVQVEGVQISATAGLALAPPMLDVETLFSVADDNLRQGKTMGRNQTVADTVSR